MTFSPSPIAILGCGWLGLPLLSALVERGYAVRGSSRQPAVLQSIAAAGGRAVALDLSQPDADSGPLLNGARTLIFTVPPGGRKYGERTTEHYLSLLKPLRSFLDSSNLAHLIFTSSTGVYGDAAGEVDERTPTEATTHSGRAVLAMEAALAEFTPHLTILRLAGLCGPDRHPGRFYGRAGATIPNGDAPVNLVHREDVIRAVEACLPLPPAEPTRFNVCAGKHPPKGAFYRAGAQVLGLPEPSIGGGGRDDKRILSRKIRAERGWQPKYENPYKFL